MKMIGKLTAVFTDKDTGEITKTVEETNHIQDKQLTYWLEGSGGTNALPGAIVISGKDTKEQKRDVGYFSDVRAGIAVTGLPQKEFTYAVEPGIHLYKDSRQFAAPAEDYTIRTAGLGNYSSSYGQPRANFGALVWFNTPCVQTTSEILTIYYQIQVRYDPDWFTSSDPYQLNAYEAWELIRRVNVGGSLISNASSYCEFSTMNCRKLQTTVRPLAVLNTSNIPRNDMFREGKRTNFDITNNVGSLIHSVSSNRKLLGFPVENVPNAPLQGAFGHNNSGTTPFYDAGNASSGTGKLTFNADSYVVEPLAEYVKLNITTTGETGVSAYQYSMRKSVGFNGNTFSSSWVSALSLYEGNNHILGTTLYEGTYPSKDEGLYPMPYDGYKILMLDSDKVVVMSLSTHEGTLLDNTYLPSGDVTPRFLPTNIIQVGIDANKDFWVACADTGLYFFGADLTAMIDISVVASGLSGTSGCYGISRGFNNRLWAYFNHNTNPDIYYSDDNGVSWTATGSALHAGDPTVLRGLHADPSNADGHLLLIYKYSTTVTYGTWWDNLNSTSSTVTNLTYAPTNYRPTYTASQEMIWFQGVVCSPNGVWARVAANGGGRILTFNTNIKTGPSGTYNPRSIYLTVDEAGGDAFICPGVSNQKVELTRPDGSVEISTNTTYLNNSQGDNTNKYFTMPIQDGIWLGIHVQTYANKYWQLLDFSSATDDWTGLPGLKAQIWTDYGWDGSVWVKDHAGSKPTHSLAEDLMSGVTVSFDDIAGNVDAFLDTDNYTFGLYDGIWMDGSTSFTFDQYMWYKPTKRETSVETTPLQAGTRNPNHLVETIPQDINAWTDISANTRSTAVGNLTYAGYPYDYQARSLSPVMLGTVVPMIDIYPLPNSTTYDCKGSAEVSMTAGFAGHVGLVYAGALGGAYDANTVPHCFLLQNGIGVNNDQRIIAMQNGVAKASIDLTTSTAYSLRFIFTHQREMRFQVNVKEYVSGSSSWVDLHKTTINNVILANYHLEVNQTAIGGTSVSGIVYQSMISTAADLYTYLGNGSDEGAFSTEFFAIDPDFIKIFIDGTEAVNVGENDVNTVLAANSYSVFPKAGIIRYSPDDVGKTITAEYTTITDS